MDDLRKAAQAALEALETARDDVADVLNTFLQHEGWARYDRRIEAQREQLAKHDAAIKDLRAALAQPQAEPAEGLGPLPEPGTRTDWHHDGSGQPAYTAEQMRAYAVQEVAAERERCAELVENWPTPDCGGWTLQGLWEAIRKA